MLNNSMRLMMYLFNVKIKHLLAEHPYQRSIIELAINKTLMMMNCFCGMVDRRKAFSLVSSQDHCQRSSPSRISNTSRAGFEPAQNLSSDFVEGRCAVAITTTSRRLVS